MNMIKLQTWRIKLKIKPTAKRVRAKKTPRQGVAGAGIWKLRRTADAQRQGMAGASKIGRF